MKQVLQSLKDGSTEVIDVPAPRPGAGEVLIRTSCSVISTGTERMLVDFGRAGWIRKARSQPDKVRQVLDKIRTDGFGSTLATVRSKLDQPLAMGYCNSGTVIAVGSGVTGFRPGDRVASNGRHAEVVSVPQNLCARVPDTVGDEAAAFTVIGSIALQGIRLLAPTLGECVAVTGLGLIGLIAVQLLRAQGCRVIGFDPDAGRCRLAESYGALTVNSVDSGEILAAAAQFSRGRGIDGVLLTASTQSSEPVRQAARMCRRRGRIVLVGVTGLELSRDDFYDKELSFQVSCSYGPGRYDPAYEEHGNDYPVGYVRWTEQRNFEAVLDMMAAERLDVTRLISHRFAIGDAASAYDLIAGGGDALGVVLDYESDPAVDTRHSVALHANPVPLDRPAIGFIGAGNYTRQTLLPAFAATNATLTHVCSAGGLSAERLGREFGIGVATSDPQVVFDARDCNVVVVSTRHDTHTDYVCRALRAGKHVFVEKPLALNEEELTAIEAAYAVDDTTQLMVGFNRRFAPQILELKQRLDSRHQPLAMVMTVNAGAIPPQHWTQDPQVGGGRIIGEACHFVDLLRYLADSPVESVSAHSLGEAAAGTMPDTVSMTMSYANGCMGTVHYFANGDRAIPKERLEIFSGGAVVRLDNFRDLRAFGWKGFPRIRLKRQDKGNSACAAAFVEALAAGRPAPISFDELIEVHRTTFEIARLAG